LPLDMRASGPPPQRLGSIVRARPDVGRLPQGMNSLLYQRRILTDERHHEPIPRPGSTANDGDLPSLRRGFRTDADGDREDAIVVSGLDVVGFCPSWQRHRPTE
jgi:hypothetical protein